MILLLQSSTSTATSVPTNRTPMDDMTTFTLILIVVLAAIVIVGMVVGARLKRRRKAGMAEFEREEQAELERQRSGEVPTPGAATPPVDEPPGAPATTPPEDGLVKAAEPEQGAYSTPAPDPTPPPTPAPPVAAPADGGELTQLKGLGPKVAAAMADAGVTSLAQLAALSPDEQEALDARLGTFRGRMARDRWVEQARLLSSGDRAGYEGAFGKLG